MCYIANCIFPAVAGGDSLDLGRDPTQSRIDRWRAPGEQEVWQQQCIIRAAAAAAAIQHVSTRKGRPPKVFPSLWPPCGSQVQFCYDRRCVLLPVDAFSIVVK
jgi:hypothetical protein